MLGPAYSKTDPEALLMCIGIIIVLVGILKLWPTKRKAFYCEWCEEDTDWLCLTCKACKNCCDCGKEDLAA